MFSADALAFQEFLMNDPVPLASLHKAVLEFLRDRDDAVIFGAQAVNAYVGEPRMTQDIDLLSTRSQALASELRDELSQQFHIALRVREVAKGRGYRLFQLQKLEIVTSLICDPLKPCHPHNEWIEFWC
jgi:hypothetical protein